MGTQLTFRAVFETVEDEWIQGRLVDLPGVITAAPTLDEAKAMLADALAEYLRSFAIPGPPTPDGEITETTSVHVVITAA